MEQLVLDCREDRRVSWVSRENQGWFAFAVRRSSNERKVDQGRNQGSEVERGLDYWARIKTGSLAGSRKAETSGEGQMMAEGRFVMVVVSVTCP